MWAQQQPAEKMTLNTARRLQRLTHAGNLVHEGIQSGLISAYKIQKHSRQIAGIAAKE